MINKDMTASKFISLILRHKPQEASISLDKFGYAKVSNLLVGMQRKGFDITLTDLEKIVDQDDKQRYSFSDDKTKIRANQGHSVPVELELTPVTPLPKLYHGTAQRVKDSILSAGINKQKRQYVHLSATLDTATKVGKRHGYPIIFEVDARQMSLDGYKFFISQNNVWLTDFVPVKYLKLIQ